MSDVVSIFGIAGTLAGAAGGTWLGWWLKSRSDQDQWWRDTRRTAFAQVLIALASVDHALLRVRDSGLADDLTDLESAVDLAVQRIQDVHMAVASAELLVPKGEEIVLYEALNACGDALTKAFQTAKAQMADGLFKERPDLHAQLQETRKRRPQEKLTISEAHKRVVTVARRHLGSD